MAGSYPRSWYVRLALWPVRHVWMATYRVYAAVDALYWWLFQL